MSLKSVLFSWEGRIPRATYWSFIIGVNIISFLLLFLIESISDDLIWLTFIWYALLIYTSLAVSAKRWHDRDKSAWWILINLIPIIGPLWTLIECGFLRGTTGQNKYGPDPFQANYL